MDFSVRYSSPPSPAEIAAFRAAVLDHYRLEGRRFPWRDSVTPYRIYVSEIMLQQTQVHRVEPKFVRFMDEVPDFAALASLSTDSLLELWRGLGYNRRALALRAGAELIVAEYGGELPSDPAELVRLPGIGPATAASICAFAFNSPVVFIETNIRRVFIHFYFDDAEEVADGQILPLVEATLPRDCPRDWYNALMDVGTLLKSRIPNPNRRSRHYSRQAPFEGSMRQARGAVLRVIQEAGRSLPPAEIAATAGIDLNRIEAAARQLAEEGFLAAETGGFGIRE